jgi:hypothetical protein
MNRYRMFYLQTSTLPPRMHHKLTKHGRFCKQNNQLPTKTHVELKDNSNGLKFLQVVFTSDSSFFESPLKRGPTWMKKSILA